MTLEIKTEAPVQPSYLRLATLDGTVLLSDLAPKSAPPTLPRPTLIRRLLNDFAFAFELLCPIQSHEPMAKKDPDGTK